MSLCPSHVRKSSARMSCGSRGTAARVTVEQVAADFGVHAMTLGKWMRRAEPQPQTGDPLRPQMPRAPHL